MYNKNLNKMKKIIIRSLRVAVVLAVLCISIDLLIFKSHWFFILLILSAFFLDATDSMLVWRLKRIVSTQARTSLIYSYFVVTVIAACSCAYAFASKTVPIVENQVTFTLLMYSGFITIFAFRYFIIVVKVMERHMDYYEN